MPKNARAHARRRIKYNDGNAETVLGDAEAAKYVAGIALHWYAAVEDTTPSALYFGEMDKAHEKFPDKYMMGTEACEARPFCLYGGAHI